MTKKIFVAATRQNDGKTMVSLGLFNAFLKRFDRVAYMKPVGQQYKIVNGEKIDKDAVLLHKIYDLQARLSDMSPIAIPRGFTTNYIESGNREELARKVQTAYDNLAAKNDFVLVEGTGHAGVGSVFDMSNAHVAAMLGTKVILVSQGGIGKPIDELIMNKALFDKMGVEIAGVIVNKVDAKKFERVSEVVQKGLKRHGLQVFGVIPLLHMLSKPSVAELVEDLDAELLSSYEDGLNNTVGQFVIGDIQPHDAINVLNRNALLIVPGNREGLILTALCGNLLDSSGDQDLSVAAIVFTEGIRPHKKIMDLIRQTKTPMMLVSEDAFSVATKINRSIFKLRTEETEKINMSKQLVEDYVDIDRILECL